MFKAVFFDLDDTLISFDRTSDVSWAQVCRDYCKDNTSLDPNVLKTAIDDMRNWFWSDDKRHQIGRSDLVEARRAIVRRAFEKLELPDGDSVNVAYNYSKVRLENIDMIYDAEPLLKYLVNKGIKLALITNGESGGQRYKIKKFQLDRYFPYIFIEGECEFGKPDPRIFKSAMSATGVSPEQACMIGDSLIWDVEGAQNAGIYAIWFDYKGQGLPPHSSIKPDQIIRKLSEVKSIL